MRVPTRITASDSSEFLPHGVAVVRGVELRGGNLEAFRSKEQEVIVAGPRDTGKTVGWCLRLHFLCSTIKDGEFAIMRKVRATLSGTVLKTYYKVNPDGYRVMGGDNPTKLLYPSGSTLWFGGLDDPGKTLSSERDGIYINQAEELALNDWEMLAGAVSGRAGHVKNPQLGGDCNPGGSMHWIRQRARETGADGNPKLRLLTVGHKDNPALYDRAGVVTQDGAKRLRVLQDLTGVRRKRLFEGIWATMEGAVYEMFDSISGIHVKERPVGEMKRWFLCQDKGYTHPSVILLVGEDEDGRWHVFREFHRTGVLQTDVVHLASTWFHRPTNVASSPVDPKSSVEELVAAAGQPRDPACEVDAVDAQAADLIAELVAAGVNATAGKGRIKNGISLIQDRLKVRGDGLSRLTIDPSCQELINEMESYHYKPGSDDPEKEFDHGPDALRYLQDVLGEGTGAAGDEHAGGMTAGDPGSFAPRTFSPRQFAPRSQWRTRR